MYGKPFCGSIYKHTCKNAGQPWQMSQYLGMAKILEDYLLNIKHKHYCTELFSHA
jgi:hypothetical protein